jgi:hypothetical protein
MPLALRRHFQPIDESLAGGDIDSCGGIGVRFHRLYLYSLK